MDSVESPLEVLSRAATMVQNCDAYGGSDSETFEASSESPAISERRPSFGDGRVANGNGASGAKELPTTKWRRDRRSMRLPDYKPRDGVITNGTTKASRSQSFNEHHRRAVLAPRPTQPHSDGESPEREERAYQPFNGTRSKTALSNSKIDSVDSATAGLKIDGSNGVKPPDYVEVPIDMRTRARGSPPPYSQALAHRPSVITQTRAKEPRRGEFVPSSMSMCDPVIDEHFRRSLGADYMALFGKKPTSLTSENSNAAASKPPTKDRGSSPIMFASDPCINFLATQDKTGEKTSEPTQKQSEEVKNNESIAMEVDSAGLSVDEHFAKALGDTWKKIQEKRLNVDNKTAENLTDTSSDAANSKILSRRGVVI